MKNSRRNRANTATKADKRAKYQTHASIVQPAVWVDEAKHISPADVAALANHFKGDGQ